MDLQESAPTADAGTPDVRTPGAPPAGPEMTLMSQAQQGDREAYGTLFAQYADPIRRVAYRMLHNAASAEDVVQETFTKGLSCIADYRGTGTPRGWFMSIAINFCRHQLRSAKLGPGLAVQDKLNRGRRIRSVRTRGVVSRVILSEQARRLTVALGFLTDAQREVVALRYEEGLSFDEIAEILHLRSGALRALVHRAMITLRQELGDDVFDEDEETGTEGEEKAPRAHPEPAPASKSRGSDAQSWGRPEPKT